MASKYLFFYKLTLRTCRLNIAKEIIRNFMRLNVHSAFQSEVVYFCSLRYLLKFYKCTNWSEQMIFLSFYNFCRRLLQRGILFQRFMIFFHFPSFVIVGYSKSTYWMSDKELRCFHYRFWIPAWSTEEESWFLPDKSFSLHSFWTLEIQVVSSDLLIFYSCSERSSVYSSMER